MLGLALMGCGDKEKDECEEGATTANSSSSAMEDTACGVNSAEETFDGGGEDYGGPEPTEGFDPPPDDTTDGGATTESTGADTTGTDSTGTDSTGTDATGTDSTGTDSTGGEGSSGSSDTGAATTGGADDDP